MATVQLGQQKIFYETYGKGQPLLLLHGWMQIGRELMPLARELAKEYQVILPDLPGYGRSVPAMRSFPANFYERDAQIMSDFIDALKVRNIAVLGYSDGGEVALLLGVTRPDVCRCVVAWGAVGFATPDLCDYAQNVIAPMNVSAKIRALHPRQDVARWPRQWAEGFCAMIAAGGDISLSKVEQMTGALLLMVGDQDRLNPPDAGRRFVEAATQHTQNGTPAGLFRLFAQTGHAIHEERPVPFTETVLDFLRSHYHS